MKKSSFLVFLFLISSFLYALQLFLLITVNVYGKWWRMMRGLIASP